MRKRIGARLGKADRPLCRMEDDIVEMYERGIGPLSIAVKLGVNAERVMNILSHKGLLSEEYETGCWALNANYI